MQSGRRVTMDGNEATASIAYRTNEVLSIYPITPSSVMGELCDAWSAAQKPNIWGSVPDVVEMQSEGGVAGAVHGSLQAGALTSTFTASQGLLLMIPNLYKIAGELTSCCLHVAARTIATHALSIFGDHSDVMACRQTGVALLASGSVQEAHDMALIGQIATLTSRVPFIHFFDGFRTSHELAGVEVIDDETLRALMPEDAVRAHRDRALTPDRPVIRGTAQNPDTFFQAREAANSFYDACPNHVEAAMEAFAAHTGRHYRPFDYVGHPEAESVLVIMGSGAETAQETSDWLCSRGRPTGVLKVRLYRPFSTERLLAALPSSVRRIAVLDRTKEPGSAGEPLYQDVLTALFEAEAAGTLPTERRPRVLGGRYGLSSKEFTPAMVVSVFDELESDSPKNHFTVGICDDITERSLSWDDTFEIESERCQRAIFYGLGSDGTVGANKNSLKIIADETGDHVQGYFVYDSKKAGAVTVSHLRVSKEPIRSPYLIKSASFIACHSAPLLDRIDVLELAAPGGTFLMNAPQPADELWDAFSKEVQQTILEKRLRVFTIDARRVAEEVGLRGRINTIMQTCYFAITDLVETDRAITSIKTAVEKTYAKLGNQTIERNFAAVDRALENLHEVNIPTEITTNTKRPPLVDGSAPDFVQRVTAVMMAGKGDALPVSAFPVDGTWPVGTAKWEKRSIAAEIPVWDPSICVQCNLCTFVCPHAAIRAKAVEPDALNEAPATLLSTPARSPELKDLSYLLQVAPEDCTGCRLCVVVCPAKDKAHPRHKAIDMAPQTPLREQERENYEFFLGLPEVDPARFKRIDVRTSQFAEPLFEYSGACAGCGETPYLKLLTQLFGDRLLVANATGCSSIYGGNLPTTPYTTNSDGRGPAWSNSLFEDNAEFGFGMRMALDAQRARAVSLLERLVPCLGERWASDAARLGSGELPPEDARELVVALREELRTNDSAEARTLETMADALVDKSVWLVGGDGWAYDIGYGGLDHVISTTRDVNVLVLDTEVYSNTGGQQSKATPLGAAAKFAVSGKGTAKKDLGMEMMSYGHAYVARVAFGARPSQTVQAFQEAESYPGPSIILAYSHCVAHGYDLAHGTEQQKLAVACGQWPLYRFDPRRVDEGLPPLSLDSKAPSIRVRDYMKNEARFRMVEKIDPVRFRNLEVAAEREAHRRFAVYRQLAGITIDDETQEKS